MSKIARENIATEKATGPGITPGVDQFESSLSELETLIGKMEHGGLTLDDSVHSFERGMALYETCKASLDQAQLKVELLLKGASEIGARVPFDLRDPQTP
jgi:exodeoxyribonuclease VII small subunit